MDNNFFSNTNPDLVDSTLIKNLNETVILADKVKMSTLGESSLNFYKKYVQPNLIPLIVIVLFVSFMIYRYMTKKNEDFDPSKHPSDKCQTKLELSETNPHDLDNVINSYIRDKENEELEGQINEDELLNEFYKTDNNIENREDYHGAKNLFIDSNLNVLDHPYGYESDFLKMENEMADFSIGRNKSVIDEAASKIFR
jgi:hypothetical protein